MSADHYVSLFHLKQFTEDAAPPKHEPALWWADLRDGSIKRRGPKNVAVIENLFAGPGGLADRGQRLEDYLAHQIESPGAMALRDFVGMPLGKHGPLPAALMRYLAWAAARSLRMRDLFQTWLDELDEATSGTAVERPLFSVTHANDRPHTLKHPRLGVIDDVPCRDVARMLECGWRLQIAHDDFLELLHIQAAYLRERHFPHFTWWVLDAPAGDTFVIGDRPVLWDVDGDFRVPPRALRHPRARILASLSKRVALVACLPTVESPQSMSAANFNNLIANGAENWIAGATRESVETAMAARRSR